RECGPRLPHTDRLVVDDGFRARVAVAPCHLGQRRAVLPRVVRRHTWQYDSGTAQSRQRRGLLAHVLPGGLAADRADGPDRAAGGVWDGGRVPGYPPASASGDCMRCPRRPTDRIERLESLGFNDFWMGVRPCGPRVQARELATSSVSVADSVACGVHP